MWTQDMSRSAKTPAIAISTSPGKGTPFLYWCLFCSGQPRSCFSFCFLPCFFFIFLGGPYIEKFRGNKKLSSALSSITAAVVGVVLNLAVWFGMHVLFSGKAGFNWFGAVVGLASFVAIQWKHVGIVTIILCAGGLGLVWSLIS